MTQASEQAHTAASTVQPPLFDIANRLVDKPELAAFLKCSVRKVDRLRAEGLPDIPVGGEWRFSVSEVVAWLKSRKSGVRKGPRRHG